MTNPGKPETGGQAAHRQFQELLPWYVVGTLDGAEHALVERYLRDHPQYREDLAAERLLQHHVREANVLDMPMERALATAWQRIEALEQEDARATPSPGKTGAGHQGAPGAGDHIRSLIHSLAGLLARPLALPRQSGWIAAGIATLFLAINLSIGDNPGIGNRQEPGLYQTLSTSGPDVALPALRIRFSDSLTEKDMRRLLSARALRITDGPTAAGLYTVVPSDPEQTGDLERLAAELEILPGIRFVSRETP